MGPEVNSSVYLKSRSLGRSQRRFCCGPSSGFPFIFSPAIASIFFVVMLHVGVIRQMDDSFSDCDAVNCHPICVASCSTRWPRDLGIVQAVTRAVDGFHRTVVASVDRRFEDVDAVYLLAGGVGDEPGRRCAIYCIRFQIARLSPGDCSWRVYWDARSRHRVAPGAVRRSCAAMWVVREDGALATMHCGWSVGGTGASPFSVCNRPFISRSTPRGKWLRLLTVAFAPFDRDVRVAYWTENVPRCNECGELIGIRPPLRPVTFLNLFCRTIIIGNIRA